MSLRYHVVSLAAVFVALGVGMLVGATMIGDDGILRQQEAMIERLRLDFDRLARDRDRLASELAAALRFQEESLPHLVGGRLAGSVVCAVVLPGVGSEAVRNLSRVIETAGGRVGSIATVSERALAEVDPLEMAGWMNVLVECDAAKVKAMAGSGLVHVRVSAKEKPGSVVVIAAEPDPAGVSQRAVGAFVTSAKASGLRVVTGWLSMPSQKGQHDRGEAHALVVGAGTIPGAVAAVLALAGADGLFGTPPAQVMLPAVAGSDGV